MSFMPTLRTTSTTSEIDLRPACRYGSAVIEGSRMTVLSVSFDKVGLELFRRVVGPRLLGVGYFIPTGLLLPVGTSLRLELVLRDRVEPVAGRAVVIRQATSGLRGLVLRYTALEQQSLMLLRRPRPEQPLQAAPTPVPGSIAAA